MLRVIENFTVTLSHPRTFEFTPLSIGLLYVLVYSVVSMVVSCIVSKIKRDCGRKLRFFIPPFYITTPCGQRLRIFYDVPDQDPWTVRWCKQLLQNSSVYSEYTRDTDRQTEMRSQQRSVYYVTFASPALMTNALLTTCFMRINGVLNC